MITKLRSSTTIAQLSNIHSFNSRSEKYAIAKGGYALLLGRIVIGAWNELVRRWKGYLSLSIALHDDVSLDLLRHLVHHFQDLESSLMDFLYHILCGHETSCGLYAIVEISGNEYKIMFMHSNSMIRRFVVNDLLLLLLLFPFLYHVVRIIRFVQNKQRLFITDRPVLIRMLKIITIIITTASSTTTAAAATTTTVISNCRSLPEDVIAIQEKLCPLKDVTQIGIASLHVVHVCREMHIDEAKCATVELESNRHRALITQCTSKEPLTLYVGTAIAHKFHMFEVQKHKETHANELTCLD